jgi:hypothetical protein
VIGEGALRHAGGLHDIAHAGIGEAVLVHHLQAFGQDLVAVGWLAHADKYVRA